MSAQPAALNWGVSMRSFSSGSPLHSSVNATWRSELEMSSSGFSRVVWPAAGTMRRPTVDANASQTPTAGPGRVTASLNSSGWGICSQYIASAGDGRRESAHPPGGLEVDLEAGQDAVRMGAAVARGQRDAVEIVLTDVIAAHLDVRHRPPVEADGDAAGAIGVSGEGDAVVDEGFPVHGDGADAGRQLEGAPGAFRQIEGMDRGKPRVRQAVLAGQDEGALHVVARGREEVVLPGRGEDLVVAFHQLAPDHEGAHGVGELAAHPIPVAVEEESGGKGSRRQVRHGEFVGGDAAGPACRLQAGRRTALADMGEGAVDAEAQALEEGFLVLDERRDREASGEFLAVVVVDVVPPGVCRMAAAVGHRQLVGEQG